MNEEALQDPFRVSQRGLCRRPLPHRLKNWLRQLEGVGCLAELPRLECSLRLVVYQADHPYAHMPQSGFEPAKALVRGLAAAPTACTSSST